MDVNVDKLTKVWSGGANSVIAIDRISHRFRSGRFACILGPSGCGKSTLIQIVGGLEPATAAASVSVTASRKRPRPLGANSVMVWQNLESVSLAERHRQYRVWP